MPISKFKATCLAELERVRTTGRPLLITRRGLPVAQVLPPPEPTEAEQERGYGAMAGTAEIAGEIAGANFEAWGELR